MHDICVSSRTNGQPHPAPRHSPVGETSSEPPGCTRRVCPWKLRWCQNPARVLSLSLSCPALGLLILICNLCNQSSERKEKSCYFSWYKVKFRKCQDFKMGSEADAKRWERFSFVFVLVNKIIYWIRGCLRKYVHCCIFEYWKDSDDLDFCRRIVFCLFPFLYTPVY